MHLHFEWFFCHITSLITCYHCVSFTVASVICRLQRILKGFTSLVAQRVFTSMMRIMQHANRGLACRIPCCRSQSGLFSASAVNVPWAHEYMRAIQLCSTDLYCIVVTSWHCVLHRKLAIKVRMTSSNFEWQQNFQRHGVSRGLSATAELLVKLTIINCYWTSVSILNFCVNYFLTL